jgi:hypothetical protein
MRVKWNGKKSVCTALVAASSSANADPAAGPGSAINRQSLCSGGFFMAHAKRVVSSALPLTLPQILLTEIGYY